MPNHFNPRPGEFLLDAASFSIPSKDVDFLTERGFDPPFYVASRSLYVFKRDWETDEGEKVITSITVSRVGSSYFATMRVTRSDEPYSIVTHDQGGVNVRSALRLLGSIDKVERDAQRMFGAKTIFVDSVDVPFGVD